MQSISILIAAADARVRQCLRRAVEQEPRFRVMWEADDGLKALCLAQEHHPHVVLLDAQMPRMDGMEATRCLRQRNHDLRILVMGVYEHSRAPALGAGADAFLTKDCGCEALRTAIHSLLNDSAGNPIDEAQEDNLPESTTQGRIQQDNTDENPEANRGYGDTEA